MKKVTLTILILLVVIVIALVIVVPRLADVDRYRPEVVERLEQQTGRPVAIERLSLTLVPQLAIRADDFALGNPPGFPPGDAVRVARIAAELDARALWNRQVVIESLDVTKPVISLLSGPQGRWNLQNAPPVRRGALACGAVDSAPCPPEGGRYNPPMMSASMISPPSFSLGAIAEVNIAGGTVTVASLTPSGIPGPTEIQATGISSQLSQVDLRALLAFDSLAGAVPAAFARTGSPVAEGNLSIATVHYGAVEATAVKSALRASRKQLYFDGLNFNLYGGHPQGNLSLDFSGPNLNYAAGVRFSGVDLASLLAAYPGARGKLTGKMEGNLKLTGESVHSTDPLAGKRGAGQVAVRNGRLPTLNLNKNLMQLLGYVINTGNGDPSAFSSLSADLTIANGRIASRRITLVGNGVTLNASGSMALDGAGDLNYDGVAAIEANSKNAFSGVMAGLLGSSMRGGKFSVPFTLTGTFAAPHFALRSKQQVARTAAFAVRVFS